MRFPTLLALLGCLFTSTAYGDPFASDWSKGQKSAARLLALGQFGDANSTGDSVTGGLRAAIEIALNPGAHTYWKAPGDAGIAPVLSVEGSTNLAAATLQFPLPERFDEAGNVVFGYRGAVTLPLVVRASDSALPVGLNLRLDYAACERICAPEQALLHLTLPMGAGAAGPFDAAILAAAARTPLVLAQTKGLEGGPVSIRYIAAPSSQAPPEIEVAFATAADAQTADLFIAPHEGWFFEVGKASRVDAAHLTFSVKVVEMPKGAEGQSPPVDMVFSLGERPIEVFVHLDAGQLRR